MMFSRRNQKIYLAILSIWIITIACSLPFLNSNQKNDNTPTLDQGLINPTEIISKIETAVPGLNERFSYNATESELTSLLTRELIARTDLGISNPKVYLRDGIVELNGRVSYSGLNLPLVIKLRLYIDSQNQLQYDIVSANIGPLPLPASMLDQLYGYFDQAITSNLQFNREDIIFEQVIVENGTITISGYIR